MKKSEIIIVLSLVALTTLTGCFGGRAASSSGRGGEVVGVSGKRFNEPTPYGMTLIKRGFLKMGIEKEDSLWGKQTPTKEISVDGFWMDETEVTNSEYKQFVNWVRDSILRTRLADPNYGGDETYMITEDKNGDPVTPHLNWKKSLPRKPNEDEQRAIESLYVTNPVTGEKMLDASQMNYRYEVYDYTAAALRRNRLDPAQRNLNTDVAVDPDEQVMISKDTAYVDDNGNIVKGDPTASGFNSLTDVLFYRADNGLYYKADGDTSVYYANLKNYTADEATGDLLAVDAEGNTTIAFYCNEGKYYAYRTETSRGQYEYSQEVLDLYDSLTDEQKADPDYVRYNYVASDMNNYASVITVKGTAENAGKWVDVTFYVHTGNTAKNYRLEVWAGSRDFTVAEDGTVSQTGTKIPANSYFFFDNYTSTDVSSNYDALLSETVDDLKNAHNVATDENLPSDYALYYTYTFYDAKDFLRYDKSLDEEELGNPYGSYKQSAYSEGIAWLLSETDEGTTLFLDFAATDVTVEADDLTSDDDTTTDTDETPAGETNVWLIISSGVLAFALVFAIVAIIVRRVHKKIGKNAKVKPAKDTRIKPKKAAPEKPVQPEQPKDENDPYNE